MICDRCSSPDNMVTRTTDKNGFVNRERQCKTCGHRWRTVEADETIILKARQALELARQLQQLGIGE